MSDLQIEVINPQTEDSLTGIVRIVHMYVGDWPNYMERKIPEMDRPHVRGSMSV